MASLNQRDVIQTLGDALQWISPYAGGSLPASTSDEYKQLVKWLQLGQQDAAKRGKWGRLLIPVDLVVTKDVDYAVLPADFHKRTGIYSLLVNGIDWAGSSNQDEQRLYVYMDPTTATWRVKFLGFTPTSTVTATLWYFYNPPIPVLETDPFYLDGELIAFYALKEYFRKARQPGSLDDARIEYENRFEENLSLEKLPTPQELLNQTSNYYNLAGINPNERQFYRSRYIK